MLKSLLSLVFIAYFGSALSQCPAPQNLAITDITQTSASLMWTVEENVAGYEVLRLPAGAPAPVAESSGAGVGSMPALVWDLQCDTSYDLYIRSHCTEETSSQWSGPISFTTLACQGAYPNAASCTGANSLCDALGNPFLNSVGMLNSETGNNYGCLFSQPNPTWFFLPVSQSGDINLKIEQSTNLDFSVYNLDVDFVCYGPFSDPVSQCGTLSESQIVDCSYSSSPVEEVNILNAQPGQYYLIMVTNFSNSSGYVRISDLGTGTGEIDCSGFRLNAFLDSNANGLKDSGEVDFPLGQFHYEVNSDGIVHNVTSSDGSYNIYEDNAADSYNLSFTLDPAYAASYSLTTSGFTNQNIVPGAGLQEFLFPVVITQSYNDLLVTIVPVNDPIPGFVHVQKIIYRNNGSQTASGMVSYTTDPNLSLVSISEASAVMTATGFTFSFSDLQPFESRQITVSLQVPTIPTVALGQAVVSAAEITPLVADAVPANNSMSLTDEIVGSYDPNDIFEVRGPQILFSAWDADDYLYYTIRFENTGTAPAINVHLTENLSGMLDEGSVSMVSSSHPFTLDRVEGDMSWSFKNILLPPTAANPAGAQGYVQYRVKPKPGFVVNDVILAQASIFFDFNPAIITNEFSTTFVGQLQADDFQQSQLLFYPNPTNGNLNVSVSNGTIATLAVFDISGKKILSKTSGMSSDSIDLSGVTNGLYFMEITTSSSQKFTRKVVKK